VVISNITISTTTSNMVTIDRYNLYRQSFLDSCTHLESCKRIHEPKSLRTLHSYPHGPEPSLWYIFSVFKLNPKMQQSRWPDPPCVKNSTFLQVQSGQSKAWVLDPLGCAKSSPHRTPGLTWSRAPQSNLQCSFHELNRKRYDYSRFLWMNICILLNDWYGN
jgi:hypothetical protein